MALFSMLLHYQAQFYQFFYSLSVQIYIATVLSVTLNAILKSSIDIRRLSAIIKALASCFFDIFILDYFHLQMQSHLIQPDIFCQFGSTQPFYFHMDNIIRNPEPALYLKPTILSIVCICGFLDY